MTTTTKYVLFGALGLAVVALLSTEKAQDLREQMQDAAMKRAKKLQKKLGKLGASTIDSVADFKDMLSNEIEGLSDDARERITKILDGAAQEGTKAKKNLSQQLS